MTIQSIPKRLLLAGALYFGYYTALGSYLPFINLYYERLGISSIQIGILTAIPVLVASTTVMVWGGLADRFGWHSQILRVNILLCVVSVLLISTVESFQTIIPFVIAYALFNSPLVPLLDSAALEAVKGSHYSYGQVRVWGSVGWSVITVIVGIVIQRFDIRWLFYSYAAFMLLTLFFAMGMPVRRASMKTSLRSGLKDLVGHLSFILFLLSVLLISVTISGSSAFLSIFLDEIGALESSIGLAWAISALSEMPVLIFSAFLIRRMGASGLLKMAFFFYAVRWLLISLTSTPALALSTQAMHGITFGAFLIGAVTYINDRAAEEIRTSAMSIFNLVTFGVGSIAGSILSGYVVEAVGTAWLFRLLSVFALAGFGVFLLSQKVAMEKIHVSLR